MIKLPRSAKCSKKSKFQDKIVLPKKTREIRFTADLNILPIALTRYLSNHCSVTGSDKYYVCIVVGTDEQLA
jgi:hypothetical protein